MRMTASYHDRVNDLQGLQAGGPFDRAEWFGLLAQSGIEPLIAEAKSEERTVQLSLTRANGRVESMRNWYSFIWRPSGADQQLLEQVARTLKSHTHRVMLKPVPDEDGSATRLETAFRAAGWHVQREACNHNHVLPVNGRSFAQYWEGRPGQMRTTLKRKAKKVSITLHDRFDAEAWSHYEAIYHQSWKPEEGDPAFLRRFAEQEGAAGRIRLGIATADGRAVAAQFWTVENGTAYIHKLAHREDAKELSAGTTLSAALFELVIDRDKVDVVDFGTGDDRYKRDWMELDRPRYRIECLDPRQLRAWPVLAKRALARLA